MSSMKRRWVCTVDIDVNLLKETKSPAKSRPSSSKDFHLGVFQNMVIREYFGDTTVGSVVLPEWSGS